MKDLFKSCYEGFLESLCFVMLTIIETDDKMHLIDVTLLWHSEVRVRLVPLLESAD